MHVQMQECERDRRGANDRLCVSRRRVSVYVCSKRMRSEDRQDDRDRIREGENDCAKRDQNGRGKTTVRIVQETGTVRIVLRVERTELCS